jgi:hypothetical protein
MIPAIARDHNIIDPATRADCRSQICNLKSAIGIG